MGESHEEMIRHFSRADFCHKSRRVELSARPGLGHARRSRRPTSFTPPDVRPPRIGGACKDSGRIASARRGQRVGRPSAYLAATLGCDVTGIDLSPEFCGVANALSRMKRLSDRTRFQAGDALELPFAASASTWCGRYKCR